MNFVTALQTNTSRQRHSLISIHSNCDCSRARSKCKISINKMDFNFLSWLHSRSTMVQTCGCSCMLVALDDGVWAFVYDWISIAIVWLIVFAYTQDNNFRSSFCNLRLIFLAAVVDSVATTNWTMAWWETFVSDIANIRVWWTLAE